MKNYIKTKFLSHYFLTCVTLPETTDRRAVFFTLAKIYGIKEPEPIFSVCECKQVKDIDCVAAYNMYERMKKIPSLRQEIDKLSTDTELAVAVKGQALLTAEELKLKTPNKLTSSEIISHIAECANGGIIAAMVVYGFALYEGLGVPQNKAGGLKYLQKAVRWNSTEAAVMCMAYDGKNAKRYADVLMSSSICPFTEAVQTLAKPYGVIPERDNIAVLLEKAFARGLVKREKYEHSIARILYCKGLSYADKQNAILSCNKEYISAVTNFPLNLPDIPSRIYPLPVPMGRSEECGKVVKALENIHLASDEKYRPLLLSAAEEYVADEYIRSLKCAFKDFNVILADVAKVGDGLFENGAQNIAVKGLNERKPNVAIFRIYGEITSEKAKAVETFLSAEERKTFKAAVGLTLDLSNVLPVLVCDRQNAEPFKRKCRVIELSAISAEERKRVILTVIGEYSQSLGVEISVDDGIWDKLGNVSTDSLINAINTVCLSLDGDFTVTYEKIKGCIHSMSKPALGFRGGL
ncbi:MAG: hypothetical protein NC311_07805 [Muribaculaceae bacterium]|nr:hypothetical protein [Muribaculaceae bacterium]